MSQKVEKSRRGVGSQPKMKKSAIFKYFRNEEKREKKRKKKMGLFGKTQLQIHA